MKKLSKITTLLLALALMMSAFTACGGGDSGTDAGAADTEPNAGFEGIVYTIPDTWTVREKGEDFINYTIPDTDFDMGVLVTTEEDFAEIKDTLPEETKAETLEEYFEKVFKATAEDKKKFFIDQNEIKICDTKGYSTRRANESDTGYVSASAAWMYDNSIYEVYMFNIEAYDDQGELVEGAEVMHEDMLEVFDGVVASIKPGDGASFANSIEAPKEIGELSFEVPEGYAVTDFSDNYITIKKDGSKNEIHLNCVTEESLVKSQTEIDGKKITTLDEYYNEEDLSDEDKMSIAGVDGYVFKIPDENGKLYDCNASVRIDDAVYEISLFGDAYDENGLKPDAVPLTDDEVAAFDAVLKSLKKK